MSTEIICIIDRSGSMYARATDAIGGFNAFVAEQQRSVPDASLTTVLFDTSWEELYNTMPIAMVPNLTEKEYQPGGTTALLDAVGTTIDRMGRRFSERTVPPEKVIVAIITDGEENSSREYTAAQVRQRVEHQTNNYGWEFIYLGANQDAWAVAASYGIDPGSTYSWDNSTSAGTVSAYAKMSQTVTQKAKGD